MRSSRLGAAYSLLALAVLVSLIHAAAPQNPPINRRRVDKGPGAQLAKSLDLEVRAEAEEVYSGFYSCYLDSLNNEVLHGPFKIKFEQSGSDSSDPNEVIAYTHLIEYAGKFLHGRKAGAFVERLVNDDGVDIHERWRVTVFYDGKSAICQWGKFQGRIGHVMPEMTNREDKPTQCGFGYFVDRAWAKWEQAYEDSLRREGRR